MKYFFFIIVISAIIIGSVMVLFSHMYETHEFAAGSKTVTMISPSAAPTVPPKSIEERIKEAQEKSSDIKGLYMTAEVANDGGSGATRMRNGIIHLADTTEINGIVIDVKEVCGPEYNEARMKKLVSELHAKQIWAIARIVTFKDASQINTHPEWYLKRALSKDVTDQCNNKHYLRAKNFDNSESNAIFWRDDKGGYWFDPASPGARDYIVDFAKKIIDLGFDELQFDYIRFPSDGDVEKAQFPAWDKKISKYNVLKDFFTILHATLKQYKPDIILSADMFGYAAIRAGDVGIGQRLEDIINTFDYVSFMVYPSHYYNGLIIAPDPAHNLSAINYNRNQVRTHPDVVVSRSLQIAQDFLDSLTASSTIASSTVSIDTRNMTQTHVRLRPWLEDFFHEADRIAGRPYGMEKVRLQIDAAEKTAGHGWLLWNASNVYTQSALKNNQ